MNSIIELLFWIFVIFVVLILVGSLAQSLIRSRKSDEIKLLAVLARHPNGLTGLDLAKLTGITMTRFVSLADKLERSKTIDSYFRLEIVKIDKPRFRIYVVTKIGRQKAVHYMYL